MFHICRNIPSKATCNYLLQLQHYLPPTALAAKRMDAENPSAQADIILAGHLSRIMRRYFELDSSPTSNGT